MANLRYLHTFIDEEPELVALFRSQSCPNLGPRSQETGENIEEQHAALYVAELQERSKSMEVPARGVDSAAGERAERQEEPERTCNGSSCRQL